jgi:hypothetical protein
LDRGLLLTRKQGFRTALAIRDIRHSEDLGHGATLSRFGARCGSHFRARCDLQDSDLFHVSMFVLLGDRWKTWKI